MPPQSIASEEELDDAVDRLDQLRRDIAARVISCQRDNRPPAEDEKLTAIRDDATQLLAEISRYELFGNSDSAST